MGYKDPAYKQKWHYKNRERISREKMAKYVYRRGSIYARALDFKQQLDQMTLPEIGYLAGLVDGEGTIDFRLVGSKANGNHHVHVTASVSISNTDAGMIAWLDSKLRGITRKQTGWDRGRGARPVARWHVHGRSAGLLCEAILPFLTTYKKKRASIVARFFDNSVTTPRQEIDTTEAERRLSLLAEYKRIVR